MWTLEQINNWIQNMQEQKKVPNHRPKIEIAPSKKKLVLKFMHKLKLSRMSKANKKTLGQ